MYGKHPLQRLASPARSFSFVLHLAGMTSCLGCFAFLYQHPQLPEGSMGGQFQFLTILGLALSLVTFALGYAADLLLSPEAFGLKNSLAVVAAPLEVLISILYWGLRLIDGGLVIPPDAFIPVPLDLGLHLVPAVLFVLDLLLFSPPWTVGLQQALPLSLALAFLYWGWVEFCFSFNGFYPYPLFELLSTAQRVVLFAFAAVLMTASTFLLKRLYALVNGVEADVQSSKKVE